MARLLELPFLVILLGVAALAMLLPAAHAFVLRDLHESRAFLYSAVLLLMLTVMVGLATANRRTQNATRSQLAGMVGAYLMLPVAFAIPFHQSVPDTTFLNAWFEMVSSFTTTGATLYDDPARLAPSLHLWRALVGWLGGFFVLLSAVAILAPLNLGGFEVISGGSVGRLSGATSQITRVADPAQRLHRYALAIFPVYGGLTLALWVSLLISGETGLVALCHAMGTLSTSGISPVGGLSEVGAGRWGEVLILFFLLFAITRRGFHGRLLPVEPLPLRRDPEVQMALACLAVLPAVQFLQHWTGTYAEDQVRNVALMLQAFWGSIFTTLSFLTTTGYISQDWAEARAWAGPGSSGLLLLGLALIGGGVATTAGGVKLLRVYALFKHGERELERLVHPNSIGGDGTAARRLRREGAYVAWIFFMLFAISIAVVMAALALTGLPFEPAMVFTIAALSTTGPLAQVAADAPLSYDVLGSAAKIILAAAMVLGRLETLAILALLAPDSWRR
jgi:trk system potassium uptake protein TrkH